MFARFFHVILLTVPFVLCETQDMSVSRVTTVTVNPGGLNSCEACMISVTNVDQASLLINGQHSAERIAVLVADAHDVSVQCDAPDACKCSSRLLKNVSLSLKVDRYGRCSCLRARFETDTIRGMSFFGDRQSVSPTEYPACLGLLLLGSNIAINASVVCANSNVCRSMHLRVTDVAGSVHISCVTGDSACEQGWWEVVRVSTLWIVCEGYSACELWTAVGNRLRLGLYTSEVGTPITQCIGEHSGSDLWWNEGGALRRISNASFECGGELACSFSSVAEGLSVHGLDVVCRSRDSCAFENILNRSSSVPSNVSRREVSVQCVGSERSDMFGWLRLRKQ